MHGIRITLIFRNVKFLDEVCEDFIRGVKDKDLKDKLSVKTFCGEGFKTWDKFQMRIYKRTIGGEMADEVRM